MINKIKTINSLAVFHDFSWDAHVGTTECFKEINILYGRNYSGKTTLSRIVRALETGNLSSHYTNPQFSVLWKDSHVSTASTLQGHGKTIRVFNEDFVRENLSFLTDSSNSQGQVKSFAVIGADNVLIEMQIKAVEAELGNEEEGKEAGLYEDLKLKTTELKAATEDYQIVLTSLQGKKNKKATTGKDSIKQRHNIFGDINYNITKLDSDIKTVLLTQYTPIDDVKRQELEQSLKEEPKPEIPALTLKTLEFASLCNAVKVAVEKKIGGSEKIQELMREYALNDWVKKGRELHKDKRERCAFCGSEITADRWSVLEKHFDEETGRLEQEISRLISEIEMLKDTVNTGFKVSKDSFYAKFYPEIESLVSEHKTAAMRYCGQLDLLTSQLERRKQAITEDFSFVVPSDISNNIESVFAKHGRLRKQSNDHTNILAKTKEKAQDKLRLHEVRIFVDTVGYVAETKRIKRLEIAMKTVDEAMKNIQTQIAEKKQVIEDLKRRLNDEEKGALKVNEYLNHTFGHPFLTLKAIPDDAADGKQIRFKIMRGTQEAFNLSEGECSLIAFCYFMAKLDDVGTHGKQPIVWIDDPISSLDGNHIFFVYSLLRTEIVGKGRFEQLFVSTHNLEFLKFLKRLTGKNEQGQDYQKSWLLVERTNDNAVVKVMPKHLKEYITEFNYLFHQIYKCSQATIADDSNYAVFYNFGNNARKFMEIYLYYKYPDGEPEKDSHNERITRIFGDKVCSFLVDRMNNEQSHLSGSFERGAQPVDIPETLSVAKLICSAIKKADEDQYNALLKSIGDIT